MTYNVYKRFAMASRASKAPRDAAHHNSYDFFFDQLCIVEQETRDSLKKRAKTFKNERHRRDLPHTGTEEEMEKAVEEFLELYGDLYWGSAVGIGLQYPRDRERYYK